SSGRLLLPVPAASPPRPPAPPSPGRSRRRRAGATAAPPSGKAMSNSRSKSGRPASSLTSVAASASRSVSRSTPATATAETASMLSDTDTGNPCARSVCANSSRRRRTPGPAARRDQRRQLGRDLAQIVLLLQHERQRAAHRGGVELPHAEGDQAARPVERLGDARRLCEVEL